MTPKVLERLTTKSKKGLNLKLYFTVTLICIGFSSIGLGRTALIILILSIINFIREI